MSQFPGHRPNGWIGPWPPPPGVPLPPGFPGPPPVPNGLNNPQWHAGSWQFNPAFNTQPHMSQRMPVPASWNAGPFTFPPPQGPQWAPGNGWRQPQVYNPHKMPNPNPDPTYWATKLIDNPLGLENMVPRNERPPRDEERDETVPQTPWIWNPPGLVSDSPNERPIASSSREVQERLEASNARHEHARSAQGNRRGEHPDAQDSRRDPPSRLFDRPTDPLAAQQHQRPPRAHGTYPPVTPPNQHNRRTSEFSDIRESWTKRQELQPTFSPKIVRVPEHYQRSADDCDIRSSSRADGSSFVSPPMSAPAFPGHRFSGQPRGFHRQTQPQKSASAPTLNASSSIYGPPRLHASGPSSSTSTSLFSSTSSSTAPFSSSSSTSSGLTGLPNLTDEPSSLLSPVLNTPKPPSSSHSRGLSRHPTHPIVTNTSSNLNSIPEVTFGTEQRFEPRYDDAPSGPFMPTRDRRTTPHPRRENPLPPPPTESRIGSSASITAAAYAPPASGGQRGRRVRRGFWNRRGDHLIAISGQLVYAPHDRAYPPELADYPSENEGYRDELGAFVPFLPDREELLESLPHHGRPPVRPYDSFIKYAEL